MSGLVISMLLLLKCASLKHAKSLIYISTLALTLLLEDAGVMPFSFCCCSRNKPTPKRFIVRISYHQFDELL